MPNELIFFILFIFTEIFEICWQKAPTFLFMLITKRALSFYT